jgi:hypothetical protein
MAAALAHRLALSAPGEFGRTALMALDADDREDNHLATARWRGLAT